MWSDGKKNAESATRCYIYGDFGLFDDKTDFESPSAMSYMTYSNCGALFNQYVAKTVIS